MTKGKHYIQAQGVGAVVLVVAFALSIVGILSLIGPI